MLGRARESASKGVKTKLEMKIERQSVEAKSGKRATGKGFAGRAAMLLLLAAVLATPASARADVPVGDATFDVLLLRPMGFLRTVVGAGLFIPAALVSLPMGKDAWRDPWNLFVATPAEYTFERPLGDF